MNLEECRKEIDRLDKELTNLLEQRMQVVAKVAAYKKANHMEIFDPRRERQVLDKIAAMAQYNGEVIPLAPIDYLNNIYYIHLFISCISLIWATYKSFIKK